MQNNLTEFAVFEYNCTLANKNIDLDISEVNERLEAANQRLEKYVSQADKLDYALASASGILCGLLDKLFVGEMNIAEMGISIPMKKPNELILEIAQNNKYEGENPIEAAKYMADYYNTREGNLARPFTAIAPIVNNPFADYIGQPSLLGLVASAVDPYFGNEIASFDSSAPLEEMISIDPKMLANLGVLPLITGVLGWILQASNMVQDAENEGDKNELPESLKRLLIMIAETPIAVEILGALGTWCTDIIQEKESAREKAEEEAEEKTGEKEKKIIKGHLNASELLLSFLKDFSNISILQGTSLPMVVDNICKVQKINFGDTFEGLKPIKEIFDKQAMPVIVNEAIVRIFYFVRRLIAEIKDKGITELKQADIIDWEKVLPFDNRTIVRMMTISSETFMGVDMLDAAVRGAAESGGNWIAFLAKFASRINYVGMGRFTIAVMQEGYYEYYEEKYLREVRILTEERSEKVVAALEEYRQKIETLAAEYIAEDIQEFLGAMDEMDRAIMNNDSDSFIHGNVSIQKVLGREPQFTNQEEFDDLMSSDIALIL